MIDGIIIETILNSINTMTLFNQHYPAGSLAFNQLVSAQVQTALDEDIGIGDLTAKLIPLAQLAKANIIVREAAIICGIGGWLLVEFGIVEISLVPPQLIGLGASLLAMIVGSLLSKPHPNRIHAASQA